MIKIQVKNESGEVLDESQDARRVFLSYKAAYVPGDTICMEARGEKHLAVKLDENLDWAYVYAPEGQFTYKVPSGDELRAYTPNAFRGEESKILAMLMDPSDILERRNLALNPADQRGDVNAYPHATANVETRDESVFAARNVIDGHTTNRGHGDWPYQSWGIGARTDAYLTLDFGREVRVDEMALYLRADFPHDAHWTSATVVLSDGFEMSFPLERTGNCQTINIGQHDIRWLRLEKLMKSDEPSAFPALSQLMVFGADKMDALNQYWDLDSDEDSDDDEPVDEDVVLFPKEWANAHLAQAYTELNLPQDVVPLLHNYFDAFSNLYGIIPLRKAFEIIKKQNDFISEDKFIEFAEIVRHESQYYAILGDDEMYKDGLPTASMDRELIHESLLIDSDGYEEMKALQGDKPYYVPSKRTLLKYADEFYVETSPEYYALRNYLSNAKQLKQANDIAGEAQFFAEMGEEDIEYILIDLSRMGLRLTDEEDANRFLSLYTDMANNTRMNLNRGFTPSEIRERMGGNLIALHRGGNDYDLDLDFLSGAGLLMHPKKVVKVGRNDPCPCGSGKKYKHCCGKS